MSFLLTVAGSLLIVLTLLDALWTTIAPRGAGPLTKRIARGWWASALWVHHRVGAHRLLAFSGPALLVAALVLWVAGLWGGWLLLFSAHPDLVVTSLTKEPADLAARAYYVGFVLFTLGIGDYVPVGGTWQVLSAVASLTGLFVITLAITYILSVVSAVAAKRQLAGVIRSLGDSPEDLVQRAWDGSGFSGLDQHLPSIGDELEHHTQRHLAYPVLHYFHATNRQAALGPAVAILFDAVLVLSAGVSQDVRPAPIIVEPTRRTVGQFLGTLQAMFIMPADAAPSSPDLHRLEAAGIPVDGGKMFQALLDEHEHDRRLLCGLVQDGGWTWDDVRAS